LRELRGFSAKACINMCHRANEKGSREGSNKTM
jgi:hypothetical protein